MNFLKKVLVLVFLFFVSISTILAQEASPSPSPSISPKSVTSYELFWPITAGKTIGDSLYSLKSFKESLRGFFIFGELKKANYNIELSNKRVVEAEKLLIDNKDSENGKKSLDMAEERREEAIKLITEAQLKKRSIGATADRFKDSLNRQELLLNQMKQKVTDEGRKAIEESIENIKSQISEINNLI